MKKKVFYFEGRRQFRYFQINSLITLDVHGNTRHSSWLSHASMWRCMNLDLSLMKNTIVVVPHLCVEPSVMYFYTVVCTHVVLAIQNEIAFIYLSKRLFYVFDNLVKGAIPYWALWKVAWNERHHNPRMSSSNWQLEKVSYG